MSQSYILGWEYPPTILVFGLDFFPTYFLTSFFSSSLPVRALVLCLISLFSQDFYWASFVVAIES